MKPIAIFALTAGAALAADLTPLNLKPGLWETTSTTQMPGMNAQIPPEALARMPQDQRAKIEAMASGRGMTNTSQSCHVQTADPHQYLDQRQQSCKTTVVSSTASRLELAMDCDMNGAKATGNFVIEAKDNEHSTGTLTIHSNGRGRPMDMTTTITSKWVSADCGNVKPYTPKN